MTLPTAHWFSPPLTTVRQAFKEAGERSVDWLLNASEQDAVNQICLPVTLIERLSTAPAQTQEEISGEVLARRLHELAQLAVLLDRR